MDSETFVIIKTTAKRMVQGTEVESESLLSNYQMIDGVAFDPARPVHNQRHPNPSFVIPSLTAAQWQVRSLRALAAEHSGRRLRLRVPLVASVDRPIALARPSALSGKRPSL